MKAPNKFAASFLGNWIIKVLSFMSAVLIVLSMRFWNVNDRVVTVPLDVMLPVEYSALSLIPDTVDVVISGPDNIIYLVDPSQIRAYADFSDTDKDGITRVKVSLQYNDDIYKANKLTISAKPEVVRILFGKAAAQ